ncbi:MAG: 2-dehydro-3-deoxyphosphogluconate aldolase [Oscillospiraceae bacterium]|jgi:2-dehydro-3-deoxyphosphogluconate aldolase/(4S)-4-hydroxy-2-oxoglutarate aldolase|nr:2-dehydro-3-deoxyphosphogluconate aldolase [Oscillospiraceae bacterium]
MREETIRFVQKHKLIAIVRGVAGEEKLLALASALLAGGIRLLEVTFDQNKPESFAATEQGIAALCGAFGDALCVGAGTVMSPAQVRLAARAGARYIISPHCSQAVIRETRRLGLVSMPGAMTPTECASAHAWGADFIKLFPAGTLGEAYLRAIRAPLRHLRFLAVGGISAADIPAFLAAGAQGFGVGGNLVNQAWLDAGESEKITRLAAQYVAALSQTDTAKPA